MTPIEEMDKAQAIATALGTDWTAKRPTPADPGDPLWMYPPRLHGPNGLRLKLRFNQPDQSRLTIRGDLPDDQVKYLGYRESEPGITVSVTRPAAQIAREITRRLLPLHVEQLERTTARKLEADNDERERERLTVELLALLQPYGSRVQHEPNTLYLNHGGIYAMVQVASDSIRVGRLSVTGLDAATRLVELLGELSREEGSTKP